MPHLPGRLRSGQTAFQLCQLGLLPLRAKARPRTTISGLNPPVAPSRQPARIRCGCPCPARSRYCHEGSPEQASHADPSRVGGLRVMLTMAGEVLMPGCMTRGSPATGRRPGRLLLFWVLAAISSVWTWGAPLGAPGEPYSGPRSIRCPECGEVATWLDRDNFYRCRKSHTAIFCPECGKVAAGQADGSYKCMNGHISKN